MHRINLLIVDDEQMIRNGLKCGIDWSKAGISEVYTADDGYAALKICEEHNIQIVITDICMPEIDGLELSRRLRHIYPALRIILLSGKADFEYAQQAVRLGAVDYLLKPINIKELTECVSNAAAQFSAARQKLEAELQHHALIPGGEHSGQTASGDGLAIHNSLFRGDSTVKKGTDTLSSMTARVVDHINLHFRESLSAQDMADLVGLSKNYFSSQFKKEMGISFVEYLNKVRVHQAKRLLKNTSYMTYEIAEIVGYSNYNYFSTVFKNITGIAPSDYRRNHP